MPEGRWWYLVMPKCRCYFARSVQYLYSGRGKKAYRKSRQR